MCSNNTANRIYFVDKCYEIICENLLYTFFIVNEDSIESMAYEDDI